MTRVLATKERRRGNEAPVFPGHLVNKTDQMLILVKFIFQRVDGSVWGTVFKWRTCD